MRKIDKKLKKFIMDHVKKAAWNIGVSHFELDIYYMKDPKQADDRVGSDIAASMTTDRRYLRGTFRVYPSVEKMWKDKNKEEVIEVVHHEIAHLATQHIYDVAVATYRDEGETRDAWETLTTIIGRMSVELDKYKNKKK